MVMMLPASKTMLSGGRGMTLSYSGNLGSYNRRKAIIVLTAEGMVLGKLSNELTWPRTE